MIGTERDSSRYNYLILGFFFLTGLTGLAYELVWIRLLILAFGSTQFAITTVLVTFMAGLALGSLIFGRLIDRFTAPLKVYAAIEIALGVYCIISPMVFNAVKEVYLALPSSEAAAHSASFQLSQFSLSFLALIVPTTLMGGTLPILVKYLATASGRIGLSTAIPYAVNTLGAVTGCLLTGFFALYVLGVKATVYTAGIIDVIIGVLILVIWRGLKEKGETGRKAAELSDADVIDFKEKKTNIGRILIPAFAISGFCSLTYETLWTRVFSLVLGSSIYAFTVMLATFLIGIGVGSILFAPFIDKRKNPVLWFAILEAVIGVVSLLSIFAYRELPFIFYNMKEAFAEEFWLFLFLQFLLCSSIMIIPTLSMGAIFPLVGKILAKDVKTVGKNIGDIYFVNTAGSIAGAFVGGFIFIPYIGVQSGVIITAALNVFIAVVFLNLSGIRFSKGAAGTVALTVGFTFTAFALPDWEKTLMTLGLYVNPIKESRLKLLKEGRAEDSKLVYYREGINAIITVRETGSVINTVSYQANGKEEARSTGGKPSEAWSILGHVPLLLHKGEPENALLVGLGSGITLGAMEHYPLKSIDVIELEPAVIEAARFFHESNENALDDPRAALHVTDGRNFLSSSRQKYDVIVSGVSDPWITGVSNLFTYEYFSELKDKLNDGGVVSLWFQNYRITPKEFKVGINTFASVFPHVSIWFHYTDTLDLVVIGSKEPHSFDLGKIGERFNDLRVRQSLARIGIKTPYDVFDLFLIGNEDIRAYALGAPLNTDERPILEFTLPKLLYLDPALGVKTVEELLVSVKNIVPPVDVPQEKQEAFFLDLGKTFYRSNFRLEQSLKLFRRVAEINPENKEALYYVESLAKELGQKENR